MIQRVFWGWDKPVLDRAVSLLMQDWQGGEFDLTDTLIIVPTSESARRLKEALARAAASHGRAVSVSHVWAPERALLSTSDRMVQASELQSLLAWVRVLKATDLTRLKHLFPVPPAQKNWAWMIEMANALADVSKTLGAGGFNFADVAAFDELPRDRERWLDLKTLETAHHELLATLGIIDTQQLKRQRAADPQLPEGIKRVLVMPSPDLPALFKRWLAHVADSLPVIIHVQAPPTLATQFDDFGTPLRDAWGEKSEATIPLTNAQIHLEHDPASQARHVMKLIRELAPQQHVAVGVADMEVAAHLEDRLQQEEVHIYEPGGLPADRHGTVQVIQRWAELARGDEWHAFTTLLRVPEVRNVLAGCTGTFGTRVLEAADDFAAKHLPVTLSHALELIERYISDQGERSAAATKLEAAMLSAQQLVKNFTSLPLADAARELIIRLFGEHHYLADSPVHRDHVKLCSDWLLLCEELQHESERMGIEAAPLQLLAMSIDRLKRQQLADPRGEVDLVLLGWLELLWEPSPALIITGMNEESVPGILISHPFMPDQLREALNLTSQSSRFARDAYLLRAMAEQRAASSLHLTCGVWSDGKDALRPSRLLFLCKDADLVARVRHLFPKEIETTLTKEPARQRAWKLKPSSSQSREPLKKISASRLRSYLACPFRYYLDHVLHVASVDAAPSELDAMAYGNLIHGALTVLQSDQGKRCGAKADAIIDLLITRAEAIAHSMHGRRLPVPVQLQLDSALQRLRAAAKIEVELRNGGWRTESSELHIGKEDDASPLMLGSARFHGIIDRIDTNGGLCRIIDYKTADKPEPPLRTHLKPIKNPDSIDESERWKTFSHTATGVTYRWVDLQLPLYAKAWSLRTDAAVSAAYFNLPKAIEDTRLDEFAELDAEMMDAAVACAEEAVRRINAGIFWPPAAELNADTYPGLVHGQVLDAFDPSPLQPVD